MDNTTNQFGINQTQMEILINLLKKHCANNNAEVFLFGSRSQGTFKQFSDIDLLIKCKPELTDIQKFKLKSDLEESDLVYKCDVVFDEEVLTSYRSSIEKNKIKIFP